MKSWIFGLILLAVGIPAAVHFSNTVLVQSPSGGTQPGGHRFSSNGHSRLPAPSNAAHSTNGWVLQHMGPRGTLRSPSMPSYNRIQLGPVLVAAGDVKVKITAVQSAANIMERISNTVLTKNIGWTPVQGTTILLFSSPQTYARALRQSGTPTNEIAPMVRETGGISFGNDVLIPLYNNKTQADLANILTHELTHAVLNEHGVGDVLPTWVNEGCAWLNGMTAMGTVNIDRVNETSVQMNRDLSQAAASGSLLPLTATEDDILKAKYNVEWEDYLAIENLLREHGLTTLQGFLHDIPSKGVDGSFEAHFGLSISAYETDFMDTIR